jgi:hypothetical protein
MNTLPTEALGQFVRRLKRLFMVRAGVQGTTLWLFFWGAVVLAARISGSPDATWLAFGVLGAVPVALWAAVRARRKLPPLEKLRASFDHLNACGGILMAQEAADMGTWLARLPGTTAPEFRWRAGRAMMLLSGSALFAAAALLLPERLAHFNPHRSLEIGRIADQLQAEVQTLHEEKIVNDKQAEDLQKQLSQIKEDASAVDPDKTWEALDHVKESDADAARQAAEEALTKTTALTQAQSLAEAMEQAADTGMSKATAEQSAQALASLLKSAHLEDGLLNAQIPPELLAGLDPLNREEMEKLLKAMEFNKGSLHATLGKLSELKLIDPATLARCNKAGHCNNPEALAQYLAGCTNGCDAATLMACMRPGNGGPGGGGPAAPMTWSDGASEKDLKFQEHVLPPATSLSDARVVGVSRAAPELNKDGTAAEHGTLDNTAAAGGSAHSQVILPEHRQAVQNFFKRNEP